MEELDRITEIVAQIGGMPPLGPDDNIYRAGFASMKALELLVELETEYDVAIQDDEFMKAQSPRDLTAMISALRTGEGLQAAA
jgi:acyl carrier protein